jgi:hypothetical protein
MSQRCFASRCAGRAFGAPLTPETYQPSGPDGEGQAGGQARKARGEPQHLSEGWTGPSQLGVKPCGHAESFAMLPSWLPQKLLIMNHFELNYKRH